MKAIYWWFVRLWARWNGQPTSPRHTSPMLRSWEAAYCEVDCQECGATNLHPFRVGRPRWRHARAPGTTCDVCGSPLAGQERVYVNNDSTGEDEDE